MTEDLHTTLLLPTELNVTAQRLVDAALEALPDEIVIQKVAKGVRSGVQAMEKALGRQRASKFTAELDERDEARDDAFVALRDFAKANSNRGNPQVAAAGQLIYDIFQRRGLTLYDLGNTQQTAQMNLLFEDLSTPEAQSALETIQAGPWLDDLRVAHEAFEKTYNQKVAAESQEQAPLLRAAHVRLGHHVQTLLGCLELLQDLAEAEGAQAELTALSQMSAKADEIVSQVMTIARARRTRASNVPPIQIPQPQGPSGTPSEVG